MTSSGQSTEDATQSLIEGLRADTASAVTEIIRTAEQEAVRLLQEAHVTARQRVRATIEEERRAAAARLRKTQAQLDTATRQRQQQQALRLLERGWTRLQETLVRRWRDGTARRVWCQALRDQAARQLGGKAWCIEHPPAWRSEEWPEANPDPAGPKGPTVSFRVDTALEAGLRIRAGKVCLDGTVEGLLAQRGDVESELLAAYARAAAEVTGGQAEDVVNLQ